MQIKHSGLNFSAKLPTAAVLETTSLKIFDSKGTDGFKRVILALNDKPFKATGAKGYRYYAEKIGQKIMAKYPKIKEATDNIHSILKAEPNITKAELNLKIRPIIDEIGTEVDIEI